MDRKKGLIAIVLFIFLGLMVFSFANPAGDEATTKLDGTNSENVKEEIDSEEKEYEEQEEEEDDSITTSSSSSNLLTGSNNNVINNDNQNDETNDIQDNNNETNTPNEDDDTINNEEEKDYSTVIALVGNLETMINSAITSTEITDMDEARDYNINEKIEDLVSKIEDEEIKKELTEKLEELYKVLNDEVKPKAYSLAVLNYTHANEGGDIKVANTGDFIRVIAYFNEKLNVVPKATIDGLDGEYELNYSEKMSTSTRYVYVRNIKLVSTNEIEDGDLLVSITSCKDMANNPCEVVDTKMTDIQNESYPYVNFDKTAPTFNIGNGASFESNTIKVTDENFDYMIIQDMTTGKKITVNEPVYELKPDGDVENGRFDFIAYDKAGNVSKRTNYYLDNVKPYITGTGMIGENEVEFVNEGTYKSVKLNVIDKNLNKVIVYKDDVEIETKTYAWNADKTTVLEYSEAGIYKIVLSDRAKHEVEYTFTIDTTPAIVGASNILVNGDSNEQSEFYATNGDEIYAYVRFNEKLGETPTFTFHNNGNDYVVDSTKIIEKAKNGEYTYSVLYPIAEELDMTDGEITLTVSNLVDLAGNETNTVLKPTNGHKVYLDRTKPTVNYTAILSKGENYTYAKNGDTIRFLIRFNEEINVTKDFVVEINGKKVKFMRSEDLSGWEYIAEYEISENESKLTEGELTFAIKGFEDKAGNTNNVVTVATHSEYNKVVYDRTAPSINWNGTIYEPNYKDTIVTNEQFIANVIETGSGIKVIYQNGADRTYNGKVLNVSGHSSYKFELIDNAGNKSTYNVIVDKKVESINNSVKTTTIDNTNPLYNSELCGGNDFVCGIFNRVDEYTFTFEEPVKLVSITGTNATVGENNDKTFTALSNAISGLSTTKYSKTISIKFNEILYLDYSNYAKSFYTVITFEDKVGNKYSIDKVNGNDITLLVKQSLLNY